MRVIIEAERPKLYERAADFVEALVRRKPDCVLGLATGSTPLGLYAELIRRHKETGLDFARVTTFNLDEYVGLPPTHNQSYHYFMQENFFKHVNFAAGRNHVPNGQAQDFEQYCAGYEHQIAAAGGIDLQVLGIGADGHIAFNEPGSSLGSRTRLKSLTAETVRDNARFFDCLADVPRLAVTMGVGTILDSRKCLLLATGPHKATAIAAMVEGPVTAQVTASALQLHRDVAVMVDCDAATGLQRRDYYEAVELAQRELEKRCGKWV